MRYWHIILAATVVLAPALEFEPGETARLDVPGARAQQISNQPWGFTPRSRSMAAQFDFQRKLEGGAAPNGGMAALQQFVTQYNSQSTSIGNLNEVTQILSGGSQGSVGQSTAQTASGNQGATATTDTTISNNANTASVDHGSASGGGTNAGNANTEAAVADQAAKTTSP